MFGFLKNKLKKAIDSFSDKVDEEGVEKEEVVKTTQEPQEAPEEKPVDPKEKEAKDKPIEEKEKPEELVEESKEEAKEEQESEVKEIPNSKPVKVQEEIEEEPESDFEEEGESEEKQYGSAKELVEETVKERQAEIKKKHPKKHDAQSLIEEAVANDAPEPEEPKEKKEHKEHASQEHVKSVDEIIAEAKSEPEKKAEEPKAKKTTREVEKEEPAKEPKPVKEEPKEEPEPAKEKPIPEPVEEKKEPYSSTKEPKEIVVELEQEPKEVKEREEPKPVKEEPKEEPKVQPKKQGFFSKLLGDKAEVQKEEPKSFLGAITKKITTKTINESQFEELFWDLEVTMLENNVAVEVIEKIKTDLKKDLVDQPIPRNLIQETIMNSLKKSVESLFIHENTDILEIIKEKKPYVICFVGINGSGKTTTIAKVANLLKENNKSVVLAAADTFRAAAIDQLEEHANNLNLKMIKHDYGADPAAVAFDAIKHAESKDIDVVLIDTAGRLHSNINLQDEMKKIVRVAKPDKIFFVGESITGNDCVEQAKEFNKSVELDGIILSKADIDEKGGAAISVSYVTKKPILYLGTGQEYKDIERFNPKRIIAQLGL